MSMSILVLKEKFLHEICYMFVVFIYACENALNENVNVVGS